MQTLRRFTNLSRLVLAWFVLSLGIAVASPVVSPQDTLLVCTGSGAMKVLLKADDGSSNEIVPSALDCPLCASVSAPPPIAQAPVLPPCPLAYALQSIPSAHIAARTTAALPARGPPSLL